MTSAGLHSPEVGRRFVEPEARAPLADEAWIGFGSNLGDRLGHIERALEYFSSTLVEVSPIFETSPWGLVDQPWFLNGVVRLEWSDSPQELLDACLRCEQRLGRVRGERNGPRIIDLDVLLVGTMRCERRGLSLPHPGLASRRSVLEPWALLAPELRVPGYDCTLWQLRQRSLSLEDQSLRAFAP